MRIRSGGGQPARYLDKASTRVNNEMLMYYWSVGRDISDRRAYSKWGNKFFQNMSVDLTDMIPNAKGFSPTYVI